MKLINKIAIFSVTSRYESVRAGRADYGKTIQINDFIKIDEVDEELLEETIQEFYKKEYDNAYWNYKQCRKGLFCSKPLFTEQELDVKSKESASNFISKLTFIRTVKISD